MKRILIMDDDAVITMAIGKLIESIGYLVDSCDTGEKAIALYEKSMRDGAVYNGALLDYTVNAGLNGIETMQEIIRIHPEAIIFLMTGRVDDPESESWRDLGFKSVISKPFSLGDLKKEFERFIL